MDTGKWPCRRGRGMVRMWSIGVIIFLFAVQYSKAQKINGPIVLKNEQLPVNAGFYISNVIDDRSEKNAIAWLLPTDGQADYTLDLKGGAILALKQFIQTAWPPNQQLRPVVMHIKTFRLDEALTGGYVSGKVQLALSFELQRGEDNVHLIDYNGSAAYTRPAAQQMDIEPVLRHALVYGFTYFNNWINREADTNIKLARGVKISFVDYAEQPEGDTIYYSPARPLTWNDFKAKPIGYKYGAEVLPSIGYTEQVEVVKGIVHVQLLVKTFLPKSAAWVRPESRNAYSLNHEQRHFDIVKIIAERFKQQLQNEKFTVDNYDGPINVQYLESFHEMNVMQEQYDNETAHGANEYAQRQWNDKIDHELKK